MNRLIRWYDYITINIYFFGLTTLSQTMTPLVVPLLVQQFVGEKDQGSFYGTIRLWTLMVALLVQALVGMISDRSTFRWGRRRPFILAGTLVNLVFMAAIGLSAGLSGMTGYYVLFVFLVLMSISSNTAQGPAQALIPDLVPENLRGRFSGVKAILEVPLPVILVSYTIGKLIAAGFYWWALLIAMGVLLVAALITMLTPEKPLEGQPAPLDLAPFIRLIMMTALFTVVILGMGQFVNWAETWFANSSQTTTLLGLGIVGLVTMALAIGVGVYFSVFISIGDAARRNRSFTWWVVNRLAYLVGSTNLASFAIYFLQGRLGLIKEKAAGPASQLIMFVGLFILLCALPSGWLADRFGRKPLLYVSGVTAALGTLVLILAPNMTIIYIGAIFIGAATGLFYSANWALGTDLVPKEEAGRYLGISNLAGAGAGAVGAYIGGPIADFFTRSYPGTPGLGYVLLFAIYGCLFLFSLLALSQVKTTRSPESNLLK